MDTPNAEADMVWQLLAMWAIVIVALVWFVRDERRIKAEARLAEAARYYAHAPRYRHVSSQPEPARPTPLRPPGGLTASQREFFIGLAASNRSKQVRDRP